MGFPINFEEANKVFKAPKGMTEEQVGYLHVKIGVDKEIDCVACVSCWQFTDEELEEFKANGGKAYLKIIGGQPAVCVSSFKFEEVEVVTMQEFQTVSNRQSERANV